MDSLGQAKRRTEEYAESRLFEGNANGAKFNLTNNHGWVEKTVQGARRRVLRHWRAPRGRDHKAGANARCNPRS